MLTTSILAAVTADRLARGVEGLTSGAYTITVLRTSETGVSAIVKNSDGNTYRVTLTEYRTFCECKDAQFRKRACKHAVALALYTIRNPRETRKEEPNLKLARVRRSH